MVSFIIGNVISPEVFKGASGKYCKFGILNGRVCQEFTAFESKKNSDGSYSLDPTFVRASNLKEGDTACVVVNTVVASSGSLGVYLRDVAVIDVKLRNDLNAAFEK